MKTASGIILLVILLVSMRTAALAQKPDFIITEISLPEEIQNPDHEFSGLSVSGEQLLLLPENRHDAGKIFSLNLSDLDYQLRDPSFHLPFETIPMQNLERMKDKIKAEGSVYEGLEAILTDSNIVYLSVETTTQSAYCYLLKGTLSRSLLTIDSQFLLPIKKYVDQNGSQVYNAGFESLAISNEQILVFFEFNNFQDNNYACIFDQQFLKEKGKLLPFNRNLPFRMTDITNTGAKQYTAINYFYKGGGADTLYRPAPEDFVSDRLVKNQSGYQNYCRLIDITVKNNKIYWKPLWEFPVTYTGYNWEGIAACKNGYFIINDRYTRESPYRSTLLYLDRTKTTKRNK